MAAAIFRDIVRPHPHLNRIQVRSAGTMARVGGRALPVAIRALKEVGLDISDHRAAQLDPQSVTNNDLVLAVNAELAQAAERCVGPGVPVFSLGAFAGTNDELPDLFQETVSACREIARQLRVQITQALPRLERWESRVRGAPL